MNNARCNMVQFQVTRMLGIHWQPRCGHQLVDHIKFYAVEFRLLLGKVNDLNLLKGHFPGAA
jgi:hypothetical protein